MGSIEGTTIGLIKRDTGNLEYGSHRDDRRMI